MRVSELLVMASFCGLSYQTMAQVPSSPEDVVRQAIAAVASNDQNAIKKLTIDPGEFKKFVWPSIASRVASSNMNAERYFGLYQKSNSVGLANASAILGGGKWEVVKVALEPAQRGKGYQLYGAPVITLHDESGKVKAVKLMGGLLERDGVYKVTTFYVSPVQSSKN